MCLDVLQPQVLRHFKMWEFPTKDDEAVEYAPQDELRQVPGVHAAERTSRYISFDESEASRSHIIEMPAPMLMNARAHCRSHAHAHLQEGCGLGQHRERDDANVQFSPISRQHSSQSAMQRSDSREKVTINHGHREEKRKKK